jgi:hypothetical protein
VAAPIAAAIAAMVELNDLHDVGELRVGGLEERMIAARTAVQQKHRRHLTHPRPIGAQLGPFDIEEQPATANINPHFELP